MNRRRRLGPTALLGLIATAGVLAPTALGKERPDLVLIDLADPPSTVRAGEQIVVSSTVKNKGKAKAKASEVAFHLTHDAVLDAADVEIGSVATPKLKPKKNSTGDASLTVPVTLPGGNYSVIACADSAKTVKEQKERNNCSASKLQVAITEAGGPDTTAPAAPAVTGSVPGSPGSDLTPNLTGTAEAGSTVRIFSTADCSGAERGSGTAADFASGGITSTSIPANVATTFRATATDAAGNTSTCSPAGFAYTHDDIAPIVPAGLDTSPTSPSSDGNPDVSGTTEPNAAVSVFTNGTCAGSAAAIGLADASGGFVIDTPVAANTNHTITTRANDAAGNPSACSGSIAYIEDSTPPTPPTIGSTAPGSPSPDQTPNVIGTAEAGSNIAVFAGACPGTAVGSAVADGGGTWTAVGVPVADDATTQLRARATDAAGNLSGCSSPLAFTHDDTPPTTPTIDDFDPDSPSIDNTPLVKGSAGGGATTVRIRHGNCVGTIAGTGTAATFGSGGIEPTVPQPNGAAQNYVAEAVDAAGNAACSEPALYTERGDTTATAETEPNDSSVSDDPLTIVEDELISGTHTGTTPSDFFPIEPPTTQLMRFEMFSNAAANDCTAASIGTGEMFVFLDSVPQVVSTDDGISVCPAITRIIDPSAGQWDLAVDEPSTNYRIEARTLRDVGDESEPNDNFTQSDAFPPGSDNFITGNLTSSDVADFFSFQVTAGQSVRLEAADQIGAAGACASGGPGLAVDLYDNVGTNIATGQSQTNGDCELIDGTGSNGFDVAAHNLAAGTYHVGVSSFSDVAYSVIVTIRSP